MESNVWKAPNKEKTFPSCDDGTHFDRIDMTGVFLEPLKRYMKVYQKIINFT